LCQKSRNFLTGTSFSKKLPNSHISPDDYHSLYYDARLIVDFNKWYLDNIHHSITLITKLEGLNFIQSRFKFWLRQSIELKNNLEFECKQLDIVFLFVNLKARDVNFLSNDKFLQKVEVWRLRQQRMTCHSSNCRRDILKYVQS